MTTRQVFYMAYDGSIKIDTSIDGSGFSTGLKSLGSMAAKGLAAVTGSLTALGGAAIKIGADFEASMSEVAAISGASAEQLDALTEKPKRWAPLPSSLPPKAQRR